MLPYIWRTKIVWDKSFPHWQPSLFLLVPRWGGPMHGSSIQLSKGKFPQVYKSEDIFNCGNPIIQYNEYDTYVYSWTTWRMRKRLLHHLWPRHTNVTTITEKHKSLTSHNINSIKSPSNPAKTASILWGEFPSKEHWQNCYVTLLDNFLEVDAIIGDIIFYGFANHILHPVREKAPFWGHCWWRKNNSLVAPSS
jgi:hypothetical protein